MFQNGIIVTAEGGGDFIIHFIILLEGQSFYLEKIHIKFLILYTYASSFSPPYKCNQSNNHQYFARPKTKVN